MPSRRTRRSEVVRPPLPPRAVAGLAVLLALASLAAPPSAATAGAAAEAAGTAAADAPSAAADYLAPAHQLQAARAASLAQPAALRPVAVSTPEVADAPPLTGTPRGAAEDGAPDADAGSGPVDAIPDVAAVAPLQFLSAPRRDSGAPLAYRDISPSGPTLGRAVLLLVEPDGDDAASWLPTAFSLAAAGYRVILSDQLATPAAAGRVGVRDQARATVRLLDAVGATRVTVVASAAGAAVAARLASTAPERVRGVVLASPTTSIAELSPDLRRLRAPLLVIAGSADRAVAAALGVAGPGDCTAALQAMAAAAPQGAAVALPAVGRQMQREAPEALTAILLEFLDD